MSRGVRRNMKGGPVSRASDIGSSSFWGAVESEGLRFWWWLRHGFGSSWFRPLVLSSCHCCLPPPSLPNHFDFPLTSALPAHEPLPHSAPRRHSLVCCYPLRFLTSIRRPAQPLVLALALALRVRYRAFIPSAPSACMGSGVGVASVCLYMCTSARSSVFVFVYWRRC